MQQFRQGELFEIVMMRRICHFVIHLDDVPLGCVLIFQGGRVKKGENEAGEII